MTRASSAPNSPTVDPVNTVHLVGRVSWGPEVRVLPSGDEVVQFRVVVPRHTPRGGARSGEGRAGEGRSGEGRAGARRQVDAIEIACWSARTRAAALRLSVDDYADLEGSLHRRFYAGAQGRVSRYEVEARRLRRVRR